MAEWVDLDDWRKESLGSPPSDRKTMTALLETAKGWVSMAPTLVKELILGAYYNIRAFIQRGRRGYSDEDVFGWCDYLAAIMPDVVAGIKRGPGVPVEFERYVDPQKEWHAVLDTIADGFAAHKKLVEDCFLAPEEIDELEFIKKLGLENFAKYYSDLWS